MAVEEADVRGPEARGRPAVVAVVGAAVARIDLRAQS